MLRELNENEMEMVSGGDLLPFNPFLDPTSTPEEQAAANRRFAEYLGIGDDGSNSMNYTQDELEFLYQQNLETSNVDQLWEDLGVESDGQ